MNVRRLRENLDCIEEESGTPNMLVLVSAEIDGKRVTLQLDTADLMTYHDPEPTHVVYLKGSPFS